MERTDLSLYLRLSVEVGDRVIEINGLTITSRCRGLSVVVERSVAGWWLPESGKHRKKCRFIVIRNVAEWILEISKRPGDVRTDGARALPSPRATVRHVRHSPHATQTQTRKKTKRREILAGSEKGMGPIQLKETK
jgi:hypothetical protein